MKKLPRFSVNNDYRLESLKNTQHHQPKLEVKGT